MTAADRDIQAVKMAARLSREHQGWWVHWGCWSRQYWAFPLFDAPRGSHFSDRDPGALAARMRRAEMTARRRT